MLIARTCRKVESIGPKQMPPNKVESTRQHIHDDVMKLKRQTKLLQDQFRKTIHAPFAGYAFLILIFLGICLKAHTSHPRHLTLKAAFAAAEASALPTSMYKVRSVYYNWLNNGMTHFEAPRKGKWERLDIWDDDPEVKKYAVKWVRSHLKCRKKKNKVMSAQLFMTHMNTHFAKCNIQHSGLHGRGAELERDDGATTYAQGLVCSTAHSKQGSARTMSEAT